MTYFTGTINNASPGATLYTTIATNLTTAGLTNVDTVVIGTHTHQVWKSPGTSNSFGTDWFLDVAYFTTGAGHMWFTPFEAYDSTNHLGIRGPVMGQAASGSATPDATTYSRFGATGSALETNWLNPIGNASNLNAFQTSTSAFGFWISVTVDRVIALSSLTPATLNYTGLFTPYAQYTANAGAAAFPLITGICTLTTPQNHTSLTRIPKITTASLSWSTYQPRFGANVAAPFTSLPVIPTDSLLGSGAFMALDVPIDMNSTSASVNLTLGVLKDVCVVPAAGTVARGDTVTIGSDTWTLCTQNGSTGAPTYLFKQA